MAAWTCRASYSSSAVRLLLSVIVLGWASRTCFGLGSYGFDIHHRFSNPVKAILGSDELPDKGSAQYYAAMAHRDRLIRGRHLSTADDQTTPLAFEYGNITYRISAFGYLHYANVSVGTPSASYLVALDTSSNMLWLPCDCSSCVRGFQTSNGHVVKFNIYSPDTSSTSKQIYCNNPFCSRPQRCTSASSACKYRIKYRSNKTSSTGVLVEDLLHLSTDDAQQKDVPARIPFGCGKNQTGIFLEGTAPNGLLGLGMGDVSIPSILAGQGLALNSFSMCFGLDGIGRIRFGDNGSQGQAETPFNRESHSSPTYSITITQIAIGKSVTDLEFYAIFDSGSSFTYLNDPAYTQITESFNSVLKNSRRPKNSNIPFEYCYSDISTNQTVNLTMKGGKQYSLLDPLVTVPSWDESTGFYCLGVVKSGDVNIIGQNFMTGYRVIFDREKMVLGWKESNCYNDEETVTFPIIPSKSPTASPRSLNPEATSGSPNTSSIPGSNHSPKLKNSFTTAITILLFVFLAVV